MAQPLTIQDLLMELMRDRLIQKMDTEIVDEDEKLRFVKIGLLQDDPTKKESNLLIGLGGKDWPDEIDTEGGPGMHFGATYEIGGGTSRSMRRRFFLKYAFYIKEKDRDIARKRALSLQKRISVIVTTIPKSLYPYDAYGERAHMVQVPKEFINEGGGSGVFIWRGECWVEWLTWLETIEDEI